MPDVSIVIKATDRYSDAIKTMASSSQHFTKDLDGMQKELDELNKTKSTLKVDTDKARRNLVAAEKQFAKTGKVADELQLQSKRLTFEQARRNLSLVTKEASNLEKQMAQTGQAFSKTQNQAGGGVGASTKTLMDNLKASGLINLAGSAVTDFFNSRLTSAIGVPQAELLTGVLGGVVSGASMGMVAGPAGAAIGAGIGALAGLVSGENKVFEAKDDAFKSYVQEAAEAQWSTQEEMLTSGSALAAQRQTDRISFATLFNSDEVARDYLAGLVDMANNTPFLYDDLTAMSKTLATYGYEAGSILPVLQTIGDTGAALGMSTGDMTAVAQALGRMKSSNKTTLEYLNILNDRGVGAVGMLADKFDVDQGTMYKMISEGKVAGEEAVEIILTALTDSFSGSMRRQSRTFSGLTSTVEGLTQELDNAMGEGYNGERTGGLARQRDFLGGGFGTSMQEAYRYMGQWQASLENDKERLERDALESVMTGGVMGSFDAKSRKRLEQLHQEYEAALLAESQGDETAGAELGRIFAEAKVLAMNEYNASEGAQLVLEAEKTLIENVRNDTNLKPEYWSAGHELGLEFSKGLAAAIQETRSHFSYEAQDWQDEGGNWHYVSDPGRTESGAISGSGWFDDGGNWHPYAVGLDYVPYDNYPALLHQGERVLTAEQARSADGGRGGVTIHVGTLAVREEADVDRVAQALLERLELAGMRG